MILCLSLSLSQYTVHSCANLTALLNEGRRVVDKSAFLRSDGRHVTVVQWEQDKSKRLIIIYNQSNDQ